MGGREGRERKERERIENHGLRLQRPSSGGHAPRPHPTGCALSRPPSSHGAAAVLILKAEEEGGHLVWGEME